MKLDTVFAGRTVIFSGSHAEVADHGNKMCIATRPDTRTEWTLTDIGEQLLAQGEPVEVQSVDTLAVDKPKRRKAKAESVEDLELDDI